MPAEPVLVFDEREVVLELEAGVFRGTLRRDLQQRAVLTFTAPERVEGLTFVSSQTGIKLQCEGLSTEPAVLPGPAGAVLEALYAASLPESLLRTETGLMGELPDGTAFSLETDAAGTLLSVTVPGGRMVFPQPVVEEEN